MFEAVVASATAFLLSSYSLATWAELTQRRLPGWLRGRLLQDPESRAAQSRTFLLITAVFWQCFIALLAIAFLSSENLGASMILGVELVSFALCSAFVTQALDP